MAENPLKRVKVKRVAADDRLDPRVVVTPTQARELLATVSYVGSWNRGRGRRLVAFFAVLYYAGVRPAEAVALSEADCQLPENGWGRLVLAKTLPVTTKKWTDHGGRHDVRGLKQRDANAVRIVPIPPRLVRILRAHLREFGTAADGRCSATSVAASSAPRPSRASGKRPGNSPSHRHRPNHRLRDGLTICDTRHCTWLKAGISPPEVAKRAGNSVEVLLKRYAGCLDNQEDEVNRRIDDTLGKDENPAAAEAPSQLDGQVPPEL